MEQSGQNLQPWYKLCNAPLERKPTTVYNNFIRSVDVFESEDTPVKGKVLIFVILLNHNVIGDSMDYH